ncbi:MAG: cbb3-type cytochrome c oxidase N-terminal domain-containing protein [Bacteroidia bacterium]|nr:cbb3-type cytochrome c oxidase N-terminal domain-containing protein [Bacteroidia bacterium]
MYKKFIYIFSMLILLFASGTVLGQAGEASSQESLLWLLMMVIIGMSVVCIALAFTILALIARVREAKAETSAEGQASAQKEPVDLWKKFKAKLTAAVPVSRESEIDLGHSFDGIRELDNKLPPWWLYGFYFTIVISFVYMYVYHIDGDWSSDQEYRVEMAEAQKIKDAYLAKVANMVNEETVEHLTAAQDISEGESIYMANCVACHGAVGQGGIGPNLTDPYWLHGGGIKNVFKSVKYGIPEKGMIPWQDALKPLEIQQVSSFIMNMEGTNPPDGKAPQGEIWEPEVMTTDTLQTISMNP